MKYYSIYQNETETDCASAFLPDNITLSNVELMTADDMYLFPVNFTLKRLSLDCNGVNVSSDFSGLNDLWLDYMPNSEAWPMLSERMMETINSFLTGNEKLKWIRCSVEHNEETKYYYVPLFQTEFNILDTAKCIYASNGIIIKRVYASSKIKDYSVFPEPSYRNWWDILPVLYVSNDVRKVIKKEKLTGISIERAPVSDN